MAGTENDVVEAVKGKSFVIWRFLCRTSWIFQENGYFDVET